MRDGEYTAGNTPDNATEIVVDATARRYKLLSVNTQNWFKFEAEEDKRYVIETFNSLPYDEDEGWSNSMDPEIYLYDLNISTDPDTTDIDYDDDSGNDPYEAKIEFYCTETGTYYILLQHYGYDFDEGVPGSYDISVIQING